MCLIYYFRSSQKQEIVFENGQFNNNATKLILKNLKITFKQLEDGQTLFQIGNDFIFHLFVLFLFYQIFIFIS